MSDAKVKQYCCTRGGEMEEDIEWKPGNYKFRDGIQRYVTAEDYIALRSQRDTLAEALALILGKNDSWRINMTDSQQQSVRKALAAAPETGT